MNWIKDSKEWLDAGYLNKTVKGQWNDDWNKAMGSESKVFAFLFPAWGIDFTLKPNWDGEDGEWVLQGETGEWDQWVCAGGGIKKKTGFGSVFVGKIGREVFCGAGDSGGVVGREVSEEGCGVCEGVSWMPVPVGREGGGWD